MTKKFIAYGEALWDLLPEGPVLGGAPCNLAYRLNGLGNQTTLVSRLGCDGLGKKALRQIQQLGLDTRHVQIDAHHPTGTVEITFDENRQPDYVIVPNVAYDFIEIDDDLLELAQSSDCICFGLLAQREAPSRQTLARMLDAADANGETLKFLDINLRKDCFTEDTVRASLRRADLLKINDFEARVLAAMLGHDQIETPSEIAKRLTAEWDLRLCVVTLAERGALCVSAGGHSFHEPGFAVKLADPCGAGDAFSAGFLHRFLQGKSISECLELGNALGAAVAGQRGATMPLSDTALELFLSNRVERIADPNLDSAIS